MIWKNALKYPVLVVGIVLFTLFITNPKTKEFLNKYSSSRIPNTCMAVKDRVGKKAPDNWSLACPGTQLLQIEIEHKSVHQNILKLRPEVYKALANAYSTLAQLSNKETLEYLRFIEIKIVHDEISVLSKTDGQAVAEMLTKKTTKQIADHLRLTVKVKEVRK